MKLEEKIKSNWKEYLNEGKSAEAKLKAAHKRLSALIDRHKGAKGELKKVIDELYSIRHDMSPSGGTGP
jgi:uncharacterized protein YhaN